MKGLLSHTPGTSCTLVIMSAEPDTTDLRAALDALTDALTPHEEEAAEPVHLARVRAAARARTLAAETAEEVLDSALLRARHARPQGATWAQLGEVLGMSGQAVGQRADQRSLSRYRRTSPSRFTRPDGPRPNKPRATQRYRRAQPGSPPQPPPRPSSDEQTPTGAAFWQAQRQR